MQFIVIHLFSFTAYAGRWLVDSFADSPNCSGNWYPELESYHCRFAAGGTFPQLVGVGHQRLQFAEN